MAEKKKLSLNDLLMNNKFVFIVSLLAAVFLWAVVSMEIGEDETRVVERVKVNISQSEDSLYKMFGYEDTYVDVTVKGKKYLVSSAALSADDITVNAKTSYIDSAGVQKLKLSATINKQSDIKITAVSQSSIEVFFDIPKTETFPVETDIKAADGIVPDGYIYEEPMLPISTVTVTGPATEINKIEKFKATVKLDEPLKSTAELEVSLNAVLSNGKKVRYVTFETNVDKLTVTVPVSKVKEIPLSVRYINVPAYYEENMLQVDIFPKTIRVAAAESVLDSLETLNIGTIGFDELLNKKNKFVFNLEDVEEVNVLDDIDTVEVNVNCFAMGTEKFTVSSENITLLNVPDDKTASVLTKGIRNVTVVGMRDELSTLSNEKIFAKVDLANADKETDSYEAVVYIKDATKCWVYGSYNVRVSLVD